MIDNQGEEIAVAAFTIELALSEAGRSQAWLGTEVAKAEGRSNPYSQAAVSQWLKHMGNQPPARVFTIERLLELPGGTVSRLLGYLPADAVEASSVEAAVRADPRLAAGDKDIMIAVYRTAISRKVD